MPYYLERRRYGWRTQVTPCWLREEDAKAALGDMEQLRVASGWWASQAIFPAKIGFNVKRPRERMAELWWASEVERLIEVYRTQCR